MKAINLRNNLKKYFYSAVGLTSHAIEEIQRSMKDGNVSEQDGKKIVARVIKKVEAQKPKLEAGYNKAVHGLVSLSASKVTQLEKRIIDLEKQLLIKKVSSRPQRDKISVKKATAASKKKAQAKSGKARKPVHEPVARGQH